MSESPPKSEINENAPAGGRGKISPFALSSVALGILACCPALLWILAPFADPYEWSYLILVTLPIMFAPISLAVAFVALLTSLVAICTTAKTEARGRKWAKGGLVLGIVTTFTWGSLFGIRVFATAIGYFQARAPKAAAVQFLDDLSKSPVAASTDCDSNVALRDLSYAASRIHQWGGLGNLTIDHFSVDSNATSNEPRCVLGATLNEPDRSHFFAIRMKKVSSGWKVYWYRFN